MSIVVYVYKIIYYFQHINHKSINTVFPTVTLEMLLTKYMYGNTIFRMRSSYPKTLFVDTDDFSIVWGYL